ncbi:hypothetical protein [Bifidobacterium longum]|uniref:hypothetical protein n=2 Tax=Bifidobacterium longum TaxID=216816 RepID=UPI0036F37A1E
MPGMWSVCRQRTSCGGTSTGRIASRIACVDTDTCCAGVCGTTIDTSRAGCPIGLRRVRCPTAGTNRSPAGFADSRSCRISGD